MNKKAQIGIGVMLTVAVAILVGLAMFSSSATFVGQTQNTATFSNQTITLPANGASLELTGTALVGSAIVTNSTGGEVVPASNYTLQSSVSSADGMKSLFITTTVSPYASGSVNITYTTEPDGYISNSGGRSIASLILVFFALAIAAIALYPALQSGLIDFN